MKTARNNSRALLIIVHYKSGDALLALLESLKKVRGLDSVDILVADNDSGENYLAPIRNIATEFSNMKLLELQENKGYFAAAKTAFEHYRKCGHPLPDWVIVCNHDVLIHDEWFFTKLFNRDPCSVGMVAPRIRLLESGIDQNPFMHRRPGWLRWTCLRLISSNYISATVWDWLSRKKLLCTRLFKRVFLKADSVHIGSKTIYAPHGSLLIFSRQFFERGGYLDENLFLYGEEICVAEMCRSLGLSVVFEPTLVLFHNEHFSTGSRISRFSYECQKQALRYLSEHIFGKTLLLFKVGS